MSDVSGEVQLLTDISQDLRQHSSVHNTSEKRELLLVVIQFSAEIAPPTPFLKFDMIRTCRTIRVARYIPSISLSK